MDPMEAIKATFFQECDELLADMESGLLSLEAGEGDAETINAVFRAVHSVKGGAGAFGLEPLVRFAHVFETTMDALRSGALAPSADIFRVLLRAGDHLTDHVDAAKSGRILPEEGETLIVAELEALSGGGSAEAAPQNESPVAFSPTKIDLGAPAEPALPNPGWRVRFTPAAAMYRNANDAVPLIRELGRLGPLDVELDQSALPTLDLLDVHEGYLTWTVTLIAFGVSEEDVRQVFEFVEGDCVISVEPLAGAAAPQEPEPDELGFTPVRIMAQPAADQAVADELGFTPLAAVATPAGSDPGAEHAEQAQTQAPVTPAAAAATEARPSETTTQPTIRVDLEKVDRLIDLVGELVINQAMLAQRVMESGVARSSNIALGLDDLEQLTREIQDSVMAIRAQPVKSVFQRMPRLAREVAAMTGKRVRLVTEGEGTEVDKTVIERLTDPLTHMLRNAIDHGLETPEARRAAGKPEEGVIRLAALHRSGRIVIEISDDGRGIDRERVRDIAVKRGLIEPDAVLTEEETDNLIFAPGFSTAETVSDVSGRGVGMDVVKRSIQSLGGRITIASRPGEGSTFTLSLPLTLAVLDGMVVTVGEQTLVVPITAIVESLQPKPGEVQPLGPGGSVLAVRGAYVPLIDVATALKWGGPAAGPGVTLLVESGMGGLAALRVDAIQGQRQVVIKSLEQNYHQVDGIAAATILGDGRVALILDVDALINLRRRAPSTVDSPLAIAS